MKNIQAMVKELKSRFFERDSIIEGMVTAMLAGEHCLLIGPPGTAKSQLVNGLCEAIDGTRYFQWLLTKFSTPEEVFGPVSLKGLENDKFVRVVDGKLPTAHIAFLDEIFKANSAILNSLLTIVNERKFHNNGGGQNVPLISLVGASNEFPTEQEELGALYDRFMVRYVVDYITQDNQFLGMLKSEMKAMQNKINLTDLETARTEVEKVKVDDAILELILKIRKELMQKGIIASDRRWRISVKMIKASAYLDGRNVADDTDLLILENCLWETPEQRLEVAKTIRSIANPQMAKIIELFDMSKEVYENALRESNSNAGMEANEKLKKLSAELETYSSNCHGKALSKCKEVSVEVKRMQKEVIQKCLGFEL